MKAIAFIGLLILASACIFKENKQTPEGGPCSYKATNYQAIVILIDSMQADTANVWCRINKPQPDTVDYYHTNNRYTTLAAIKQEKLKLGDTLIYEHRQITDGSCNPDVFRLMTKQEIEEINNRGIF